MHVWPSRPRLGRSVPEARGCWSLLLFLLLVLLFPDLFASIREIRGEPVFGVVLAFPITGSPDHGDHPILQSLT
jgi:hypothetical protein